MEVLILEKSTLSGAPAACARLVICQKTPEVNVAGNPLSCRVPALREQKNWRAPRTSVPLAHHHLPECTKDHFCHLPPRRPCRASGGSQDGSIKLRGLPRG